MLDKCMTETVTAKQNGDAMKTRKALRSVAGSVATISAVILMSAPSASADPSCIVSTSGSPGSKSFTLHVNSNPCGRKVRAYIDPTVTGWTYGRTITGTGTSKAEIGLLESIQHYGHQVYVNGEWVTYQDG